MVFARRFVLLNRYNTSYKIAGDFDLYLRAARTGILADTAGIPFVAVEIDGVASANPLKAYGEYLKIAYRRLNGRTRIVAIVLIGVRGLCVFTAKTIFPKRWIMLLRGV
jgi:hypothetical protein